MKTLFIVTSPSSIIGADFIVEHKDFSLSIVTPVYNHHFFKNCIVPEGCDYRQGSTVVLFISVLFHSVFPLCCSLIVAKNSLDENKLEQMVIVNFSFQGPICFHYVNFWLPIKGQHKLETEQNRTEQK